MRKTATLIAALLLLTGCPVAHLSHEVFRPRHGGTVKYSTGMHNEGAGEAKALMTKTCGKEPVVIIERGDGVNSHWIRFECGFSEVD